jgi:nucleoside-diphosphate-sugar epimerase
MKLWGANGEPDAQRRIGPNAIPRRWADISAAKKVLNYAPRYSLEQGTPI